MYNCCNTVRTTSIEEGGSILLLTIPNMQLRHGQHLRVCFAQNPPTVTDPLAVYVSTNGDKFPILQDRMDCAFGAVSLLYSDQLQSCKGQIKPRQYLDLVFSANTKTFNYCGPCRCLPRANIEYPRVPASATTKKTAVEKEAKAK